ncbi:hypothetical protein SM124_07440 [Bacillus sp. 31A1R]|uniref:Uncharacterized protein n=1 Tax=Robertmurraya mangrovi TaxID=3098077 RepID=A0ABU5IWQ5_9BACI|nr:hypothetical protein [Bacillus sp. 31A1R]MDZ5471579.1 hypothetical protein [Bacillus sp. 31A1R]
MKENQFRDNELKENKDVQKMTLIPKELDKNGDGSPDGPFIIGEGDVNLSPDAGRPLI